MECAFRYPPTLKQSRLKLRMGINTGPVYWVADINGEANVSGDGINMAQRIMDAGDAGHILVSKSAADILLPLQEWSAQLHDLGVHPVKHGVKLQFSTSIRRREIRRFPLFRSAIPWSRRRMRRGSYRRGRGAVAFWPGWYGDRMMPVNAAARSPLWDFAILPRRPETDWVSTDLAEGLRTRLASTGKMRIFRAKIRPEMWRDLGLTRLDTWARAA